MQAALKQSATHKGIHRFGMQLGTLPGSRWMFAKGGMIVKSVEVKPLRRLTAQNRRHRLGGRGLRFLPDTEGLTLARRLILDRYCNDSFRVALIAFFNVNQLRLLPTSNFLSLQAAPSLG